MIIELLKNRFMGLRISLYFPKKVKHFLHTPGIIFKLNTSKHRESKALIFLQISDPNRSTIMCSHFQTLTSR